MKQKTKQLIMTLVALLALTTHAWATDPKVYASGEVELYSLQVGDILMPGVTLTKGDKQVDVTLRSNRFSDGEIIIVGFDIKSFPFSIGVNGLITAQLSDNVTHNCMPITEDGKTGNAWVVTFIDEPSYRPGYKEIYIGGTTYSPPATPVPLTRGTGEKINEWTLTNGMPAGNVTVNVEYWPGMLTLPAASEGGTVTLEGVTNNTIIDENFDDYTVGGNLAQTANAAGNSNWTTWNNLPGSGEDGTLATLNGNTCLKVTTNNDQVLLLGDQTSGMWEYSLDVYVPEGKFGYFNLLHDFAGSSSTWALQCYFNAYNDGQNTSYYPGHGTVHAGSNGTADLPCVFNEWMHVRVVIDIDNDLAKLYFNGQFICEWQWSLDSYGDDSEYGGKLAACNIFGEDDEFYVDNIKFTKISALPAGFERDGDGNIYVESGTQFTLVTTPAENYHLASLSDGTNTYDVDDDGKVTITMPDADLTLTAEFAENTYDVSLNKTDLVEGEPALWKAKSTNVAEVNLGEADLEGVKKSETVTVTYTGSKKVIGVKAEKYVPRTLADATTADVGMVVCAAGHLHTAKEAVPDGCTAVGILGKVTETGHGLILALQDATAQTWNTINGWTSVTTYVSTTLKLLPNDAARGTNLTSYTSLGATAVSNWAVAQKSDYDAIFTNLGSTVDDGDGTTYDDNVNAYITTGVGGTAISDNYYLSATDGYNDLAWFFDFDGWTYSRKSFTREVRPVLGF